MAEVRRRCGSGSYGFARKIWCRYILTSPNQQRRSATSAGALFSSFQNGELFVAESAADGVTVGVSQVGYARATPQFNAVKDVWENGDNAGYYGYLGLEEYSLSNKNRVKHVKRNLLQSQGHAMFQRCFCTFRYDRQQVLGSRYLCWAQEQLVFSRAYSGDEAQSVPIYKTKTGYYDTLEVEPAATQAQIKTAYYKQSFIYHPDRNANSVEATNRFAVISEAYTVLGNRALRKKYDRGLLSLSDLTTTARPSAKDTAGSSAKQQTQSRSSVVDAGSQGGVFDFDTFVKNHYNEQLLRQRDIKVRKEEIEMKERQTIWDRELDKVMDGLLVVMIVLAVFIVRSI